MPDHSLHGCRVLVVEDEYVLADELATELSERGAVVVGPAGSVHDALRLIAEARHLDGAVMDVNLRGEMAFAAADALIARGIPVIFTTGYDASVVPPRLQHIVRCEKPVTMSRVVRALGQIM